MVQQQLSHLVPGGVAMQYVESSHFVGKAHYTKQDPLYLGHTLPRGCTLQVQRTHSTVMQARPYTPSAGYHIEGEPSP